MGPDRWLLERGHDLLHEGSVAVDVVRAVSALGKPPALAIASLLLAAALLLARRPRAAAFVVAATIGAWLVDNALKDLLGRERPHVAEPLASASGASFPSGHAMTSAAAYGAALVLLLPRLRPRRRPLAIVVTVTVVALIGVTRVVLGVHWPTDVLGGWIFGVAWLAACAAILRPAV